MTTNTVKTAALLGLQSALLVVGGGAIMGRNGLYVGLLLAGIMNFVVLSAALSSMKTNHYFSTRKQFTFTRGGFAPGRNSMSSARHPGCDVPFAG